MDINVYIYIYGINDTIYLSFSDLHHIICFKSFKDSKLLILFSMEGSICSICIWPMSTFKPALHTVTFTPSSPP